MSGEHDIRERECWHRPPCWVPYIRSSMGKSSKWCGASPCQEGLRSFTRVRGSCTKVVQWQWQGERFAACDCWLQYHPVLHL